MHQKQKRSDRFLSIYQSCCLSNDTILSLSGKDNPILIEYFPSFFSSLARHSPPQIGSCSTSAKTRIPIYAKINLLLQMILFLIHTLLPPVDLYSLECQKNRLHFLHQFRCGLCRFWILLLFSPSHRLFRH